MDSNSDAPEVAEEFSAPARRRRARSQTGTVVAVLAVILTLVVVLSMNFGGGAAISRSTSDGVRGALERLDRASKGDDVSEFVGSHQQLGQCVVQWIEAASESGDIETLFVSGDESICEGCVLLPRAVRALLAPVPPSIVARMTQIDKDRFDLAKLEWAAIAMFGPLFEAMCDRYVDPATGKLRMAQPD